MSDPKGGAQGTPSTKHELRDAEIKPIVVFLLVLGLLIVASFVSMVWFFSYLDSRESARDAPVSPLATEQLPPEPRLQATPRGELDEVLNKDAQRLNGYKWIDQDAGVVQIPIERAMELIAERGLPAREDGGTGRDD